MVFKTSLSKSSRKHIIAATIIGTIASAALAPILAVQAATVGNSLQSPEAGWQRINDSNPNFIYEGNWHVSGTGTSAWYQGDTHYPYPAGTQDTIKFKFNGTKLRIIAQPYTPRSGNVQVKIDGVIVGSYTLKGNSALNQTLLFERTGLASGTHSVEVLNLDTTGEFIWDAIDIDSGGYMVPFLDVLPPSEVSNVIFDVRQ